MELPRLSGGGKALSLHREDGFACTEMDSAATCWPPGQSVTLQTDGLDATAAERGIPIFHTDSLSWNCSQVSNTFPEQADCGVYEPIPFSKHLRGSILYVTHARIAMHNC